MSQAEADAGAAAAQAARFASQSPRKSPCSCGKSLQHDITLGEVTQEGIDAAEKAGVSAKLLKRARAKLAGKKWIIAKKK